MKLPTIPHGLELIQFDASPELAKKILETCNRRNRPVRRRGVKKLVRAISRGDWDPNNGATLAFCDDPNIGYPGLLVDGQHRLEAIAQSDRSVRVSAILHASRDAFDTIDGNGAGGRTPGDTLSVMGFGQSNLMGAALRYLKKHLDPTTCIYKPAEYSNSEISELAALHPEFQDSVRFINNLGPSKIRGMVPPSFTVYFHYVTRMINPQKSERFLRDFFTGLELKASDPVYMLRTRLMDERDKRNTVLTTNYRIAFFIKAWHATLTGKRMRLVRIGRDEELPLL